MSALALSPADQDLIDAGAIFLGGTERGVVHRMEIGKDDVVISTRTRRFRVARTAFELRASTFDRIAKKHSLLRVEGGATSH